MKTFYKAAITTGLLATSMAIAMPADALTFNFSYTFESGVILSGVLEGDIVESDVVVSEITSSLFNGLDIGPKQLMNASSPTSEDV